MNWFQMLHFLTASYFSSVLSREALFCISVCQLWWKSCLVYWLNQSCSLPGLVSIVQKDWLLSLVISLLPCVLWQSVDHTKDKSPHSSNKCWITPLNGLFGIWFPTGHDKLPKWTPIQLCNLWTARFSPKIYSVSTSCKLLKSNFRCRRIYIPLHYCYLHIFWRNWDDKCWNTRFH